METRGKTVKKLARLLAGFLTLVGISTATRAQVSITLGWDKSTDPAVAGYRVYEGVASRVYTTKSDVGKATSTTIPGLMPTTTYYFAVTAYTTNGLESAYSGEINYAVPAPTAARLQMAMNSSKQIVLTGTAPPAYKYAVLASKDLKSWTTNGTLTVSNNAIFQFTDTTKATNSPRFYRLRQTSP
jgi:hypothetical protein